MLAYEEQGREDCNAVLLNAEVRCSSYPAMNKSTTKLDNNHCGMSMEAYDAQLVSKLFTNRSRFFANQCSFWIQEEGERLVLSFRMLA